MSYLNTIPRYTAPGIALYNGDCTKGGMQAIPDASVDCILTDPPYKDASPEAQEIINRHAAGTTKNSDTFWNRLWQFDSMAGNGTKCRKYNTKNEMKRIKAAGV